MIKLQTIDWKAIRDDYASKQKDDPYHELRDKIRASKEGLKTKEINRQIRNIKTKIYDNTTNSKISTQS